MRMLGLSGQMYGHCGPYVRGLHIRARRTRRIARAREKRQWKKAL